MTDVPTRICVILLSLLAHACTRATSGEDAVTFDATQPSDAGAGKDAEDVAEDAAPDAAEDAGTAEDAEMTADAAQPRNAFLELLDALAEADVSQRQDLVDGFVAQHGPDFPYVEGELASFIHLDAAANQVFLAGDHTCWDGAPVLMTKVAGTNLWHASYAFSRDARVDYKFIVDGNWILDPRNPRRIEGGFGENSELRMPDWVYPVEIDPRPGIPRGTIEQHAFSSTNLQNQRTIQVYLPPGYPNDGPYGSIYVHDGAEYLSLAGMQNVLDALIFDGMIDPVIGIFVPPVDRSPEYVGARVPLFEQFVVEELLPFVDGTWVTDPSRRAMMGTSNGGYISLRIGYDYPDLFPLIAGQSSAVEANDGLLIDRYDGRVTSQRIFLSTGTLCDFDASNDALAAVLSARGYAHTYRVFEEGHSWGNWRAHLDEILLFLFPR
jgi:enterochelin esterase family protein